MQKMKLVILIGMPIILLSILLLNNRNIELDRDYKKCGKVYYSSKQHNSEPFTKYVLNYDGDTIVSSIPISPGNTIEISQGSIKIMNKSSGQTIPIEEAVSDKLLKENDLEADTEYVVNNYILIDSYKTFGYEVIDDADIIGRYEECAQ